MAGDQCPGQAGAHRLGDRDPGDGPDHHPGRGSRSRWPLALGLSLSVSLTAQAWGGGRQALLALLEQTTQLGRWTQSKAIRGDQIPLRASSESGGCLGLQGLTACPQAFRPTAAPCWNAGSRLPRALHTACLLSSASQNWGAFSSPLVQATRASARRLVAATVSDRAFVLVPRLPSRHL